MPLSGRDRDYAERKLYRGGMESLAQGRARGLAEAPDMASIMELLNQLPGIYQGLEAERQGIMGRFGPTDPNTQRLAQQAAFAPIEGMRPYLERALSQAANQAGARGMPQSSISAALQAQAIPQIMEPALAQARGQYSQNLLDLPFRQAALGLESVGMGANLSGILSGAAGQRAGLRSQAFADLGQAMSHAQMAQQLAKERSQSGFWKSMGGLLGGLGGAAITGGLSAIPGIGGMMKTGMGLLNGNPPGGGQTSSSGFQVGASVAPPSPTASGGWGGSFNYNPRNNIYGQYPMSIQLPGT